MKNYLLVLCVKIMLVHAFMVDLKNYWMLVCFLLHFQVLLDLHYSRLRFWDCCSSYSSIIDYFSRRNCFQSIWLQQWKSVCFFHWILIDFHAFYTSWCFHVFCLMKMKTVSHIFQLPILSRYCLTVWDIRSIDRD